MSGRYRHKMYSIRNGFFLTLVSLLQVYVVITSRTSQGLYLRRAAFVQCLILARSISPLNCKFNTSLINNNICLLQLISDSFILVPTSLLPLHSVILLSDVRLFPWSSWISSRGLRRSHWCHPWPLSEIPVRCLSPGRVGIVGWGGATFTSWRI